MYVMKKKPDIRGFVYSTDPDFHFEEGKARSETLSPAHQELKIKLETKHRAGKTATIVQNFTGKIEDLEELGKKLKSFCGAGGSVKNSEIIIQGDHRKKVLDWLKKNNFSRSKII
jgi:translation initiation factor 1